MYVIIDEYRYKITLYFPGCTLLWLEYRDIMDNSGGGISVSCRLDFFVVTNNINIIALFLKI